MPDAPPLLNIEPLADAYVIHFSTQTAVDPKCIAEVRRAIRRLARDEDHLKVILDLQQVTFLSSEAIGLIVSLNNTIIPEGGHLHLANVSRDILLTFDTLLLHKLVRIFGSTQDALDGFERQPPR
jgi:anti-anti-sigma factor